jgi:hypothetical protein
MIIKGKYQNHFKNKNGFKNGVNIIYHLYLEHI